MFVGKNIGGEHIKETLLGWQRKWSPLSNASMSLRERRVKAKKSYYGNTVLLKMTCPMCEDVRKL